MNCYVALDLETTGLHPKKDRILEIGAIRVIDGKVSDEFSVFVNPKMVIPERITEITGITQDMVAKGASNEEAVRGLLAFCEGMPILGHNILFDYSFVKHSAINLDLNFEKQGIDTLRIARKVLPELESRSLQYLRRYYGIEQEREHRALEDAKTAHLLYERMRDVFEGEQPEIFRAVPLVYKVKKQGAITNAQKGYLHELVKYHRIELDAEIESLTKNEASRVIDGILSSYGRIKR